MEIPKLKRSPVGKDDAPPKVFHSVNPSAFQPIGGKPISLFMLTQHACRWPIDNPKAILFCGESSHGETYCPTHYTMSRGKGTQSERNALRDAVRRDMSVPSVGEV